MRHPTRLVTALQLTILAALLAIHVGANAQNARSPQSGRLAFVLAQLADAHAKKGHQAIDEYRASGVLTDAQDRVRVQILGEPGRRLIVPAQTLATHGVEIIAASDNVIEAYVPINQLDTLADASSVIWSISLPPQPHADYKVSQGVDLTRAAVYRLSSTGANVKLAIIDLSFGNVSKAIAAGALPADLTVADRMWDCTGGSCAATTFDNEDATTKEGSHGSAVAEIAYEMAPGAQLYLLKIDSPLSLNAAMLKAISLGVTVINHSVGWFNQNFYDGACYNRNPVCIAEDAYANGVLWVNSAGNSAQTHFSGTFTDSNNDGWHEFGVNTQGVRFSIPAGARIQAYLTWNAWNATNEDYDLYLLDGSGNDVGQGGKDRQHGTQLPAEMVAYDVPARPRSDQTLELKIKKVRSDANHQLQLFLVCDCKIVTKGVAVSARSILSPADAPHTVAVGAVDKKNWTTGPQESFSSLGPAGDGREKPDIVGPDNVSSYSFGLYGTNFSGTSASAPHVAGAAAQILSKNPHYSTSALRKALLDAAVDMPGPLQINTYGNGRLQLPYIIDWVNQPPPTLIGEQVYEMSWLIREGASVVQTYLQYAADADPLSSAHFITVPQSGATGLFSASVVAPSVTASTQYCFVPHANILSPTHDLSESYSNIECRTVIPPPRPPVRNQPPVAGFLMTSFGRTVAAPNPLNVAADPATVEARVTFTDGSSDLDGHIVSRRWTTNTGCTPSEPPPCLLSDGLTSFTWGFTPGTYSVTLTVTDDGTPPLSNQIAASINVAQPGPSVSGIRPTVIVAGPRDQAFELVGATFQQGLTIRITFPGGGTAALSGQQVPAVGPTLLTALATFADAGAYALTVVNPDGSESSPFTLNVVAAPQRFFEIEPGCSYCLGGIPSIASVAVDSSANVVGSVNFGCAFGFCGTIVVSISPDGQLRWRSPTNLQANYGNPLAPDFIVAGPAGSVYYRDNLGSTTSLGSQGDTVSGWPVTVPPPMDNANGLSVDADGTVLLHGGTIFSNMFVGWPSALLALRPDGVQVWRTDFSLPTQAPYGDVSGPLFVVQPPFSSSFDTSIVYRLDGLTGAIACQAQTLSPISTAFTPNNFAWNRDGLFYSNSNTLLRFFPDCGRSAVYITPKQFVSAWASIGSRVLASDFSLLPASNNFDPASAGLLGVTSNGTSVWRLDRVQPSVPAVTSNPLIAADERFFFVRGLDRLDGALKIFVIDAPTGVLTTTIDAAALCPSSCSAAVGPNHTLYVVSASEPSALYRLQVPVE
jgi:hypothetical protein